MGVDHGKHVVVRPRKCPADDKLESTTLKKCTGSAPPTASPSSLIQANQQDTNAPVPANPIHL